MSSSSTRPEPATTRLDDLLTETDVGSVFVSNYPPYSFWRDDQLPAARNILQAPPDAENAVPDLGLYLHIPFCRKRCKFCYFRVYVDKNAAEIKSYLDALASEVELYSTLPRIAGRQLKFIYIGGGTPSYISARHLAGLVDRLRQAMPWEAAEEIAFECEPGTLTEPKIAAIAAIGVTRLSLGVENLNDDILRENGRAHVTREVYRVMPWIAAQGFAQVNIDLIAGMVGESWETWKETVTRAVDLDADSITTYQMELPFNTVYSKAIGEGQRREMILADWQTKREWHAYASECFAAAGYRRASAYTMVKEAPGSPPQYFVYRDALWRGSDMIGAGVASFSHMGGVHYQNTASWDEYTGQLAAGDLPLARAFATGADERLTREFILQLKLGRVEAVYFRDRHGVEISERFAAGLATLRDEGMLTYDERAVELTDKGLLRVDQLLPVFYEGKYRNARYT